MGVSEATVFLVKAPDELVCYSSAVLSEKVPIYTKLP